MKEHGKALRYTKGKQISMSLYLAPRKYWALKVISKRRNETMQCLLRDAVDELLARELKGWPRL
jgi:hypothetical protein